MKGYYLFAPVEPENAGPDSGVEKKVRAQHKALSEHFDCELVILPPAEYTGSAKEKIVRRLPFTAAWRKWDYHGEFDDADFLYIRQVYHDDSFVRYLKAIKKNNPKIKIIYEIPTYPYDKETSLSVSNFSFTMKEKLCRKKAAKYMDRIVTFYGQDTIWGVPCINLMNGYDFSSVVLPERTLVDNTLRLISVSSTASWHGYDRVIEGLHLYYENGGTMNISYTLVGNATPDLVELVEKYDLQDKVIFAGKQPAGELYKFYQDADIGVDVLGGHRKDYPISSSLKSREYGAYGLPLITSSPVDYLPKDYEYQLLLPYDDSPIHIDDVIAFYHRVYDSQDLIQVEQSIRSFAKIKCDMAVSMQLIIDYLL